MLFSSLLITFLMYRSREVRVSYTIDTVTCLRGLTLFVLAAIRLAQVYLALIQSHCVRVLRENGLWRRCSGYRKRQTQKAALGGASGEHNVRQILIQQPYPVLRTIQSALHFTSLTDLFNQTPSRLLWEASSHML